MSVGVTYPTGPLQSLLFPHPQELTNWYWVFLRPVEPALYWFSTWVLVASLLINSVLFSCKGSECRVSASYWPSTVSSLPLSTPGCLFTSDNLLPALHGNSSECNEVGVRQDRLESSFLGFLCLRP